MTCWTLCRVSCERLAIPSCHQSRAWCHCIVTLSDTPSCVGSLTGVDERAAGEYLCSVRSRSGRTFQDTIFLTVERKSQSEGKLNGRGKI